MLSDGALEILSSNNTCSLPITVARMHKELSFGKEFFGNILFSVFISGFRVFMQFLTRVTSYFRELTVDEIVSKRFSVYCEYFPCLARQSYKKNREN